MAASSTALAAEIPAALSLKASMRAGQLPPAGMGQGLGLRGQRMEVWMEAGLGHGQGCWPPAWSSRRALSLLKGRRTQELEQYFPGSISACPHDESLPLKRI